MAKTNFRSKRERKQYRKGLIQGALKNKVADIQVGARQRAEFYANLRRMKLKRHEIAREFTVLADTVTDLQRDLRKAADRKAVDPREVEEALAAVLKVRSNVGTVAEDYQRLAHKKIYFGEVAAA